MASPAGRVQPFSTGACYVWVSFGGPYYTGAGPFLFGTCEGYPKHERRPDYLQLMNDVSGRKKPMDMSFQGEDATIALDMTVWDDGVAQMLDQFADMSGRTGTATPGSYQFRDVGSLMGYEQFGCQVWIQYSYGSIVGANGPKLAYTGGGLPGGYHYPQCIPFAPSGTVEGAQGMQRQVMFYAWPVCSFQTSVFTLYDFNMAAVNGKAINGPFAA